MGLKCSLVGHNFGEPEREQEREERGDEVVLTIREVKSCERCGSERIVSESTEVRPVREDPTDSETGDEAKAETAEEPTESTTPPDRAIEEVEPSHEPGQEATDPATDDGVILDDDDDEAGEADADRGPGEWPEAEDTRLSEAEASAATEAGDESPTPPAESSPPEEESESTDSDAEETLDSEAWPDPHDEDEGFDATAPTEEREEEAMVEAGDAGGAGFVTPDATSAGNVSSAVFVCPSCGFEERAAGSSLRSGDICPDCKRGYLAERSA